ncbi:MAG: SDR family oxidoreductase [Gemmatimonadota bacterium]|nr:MAG: SDR family oxidoreductase [Gemmatimonadota bacterium]
MSRELRIDARRAMGWATLVGGVCVLLFWAAYLSSAADLGQQHQIVGAFESAFPIADALFCLTLFSASYCLLGRRPAGPYFLVAAGAMSLYLGVLDTTFYGIQGLYFPLDGSAALELFVNTFCIGGGAFALWFGWKFRTSDTAPACDGVPRSVRDRVVVVTGSDSGIGAATARRLVDEGATVVLADIDEHALERRRRELAAAGGRVVSIPADVSDPDSVSDLMEGALRACGRIDALVNCAGVIHPGATETASLSSVRRQVETNLLGTINTTQALLPYFRRRRGGHLIHLASLGGIVPLPGEATYAATKFAVRGFCLSLALELRDTPIRVSVVNPDSVETAQLQAEALHQGSSLSFMGAPLAAADVADAIVRTMRRPRLEVSIPRLTGGLVRVVGLMPRVLAWLYPLLDRHGRRRREDYRRLLGRHALTTLDTQPLGAR